MKCLFLDADGVLNSRDTTDFKNNLWPVDPYMAFMVGKIQLDTDCVIVVSSSWRHHPEGMAAFNKLFNNVIDKTPSLNIVGYENSPRGHEIQAWLDAHPEVTRYAIIDDDSDMLDTQKPNFFQTTFQHGLTEEIALAVTNHLNA